MNPPPVPADLCAFLCTVFRLPSQHPKFVAWKFESSTPHRSGEVNFANGQVEFYDALGKVIATVPGVSVGYSLAKDGGDTPSGFRSSQVWLTCDDMRINWFQLESDFNAWTSNGVLPPYVERDLLRQQVAVHQQQVAALQQQVAALQQVDLQGNG